MSFVYSYLGNNLTKQDVRRDINPALLNIQNNINQIAHISVDNVSGISSIDTSLYGDGISVYSRDLKDYFILDKTSSAAADGITVIDAGIGRWIRLNVSNPSWGEISDWHIDSINGDDTNLGNSLNNAVKSWAEVVRRLGLNPLKGAPSPNPFYPGSRTISFTIHEDLDLNDCLSVNFITSNTFAFAEFNGIPKIVESGTISASAPSNPATNTQASIASIDVVLSAYITGVHRIKMTSGTALGNVFYAVKDLGGGSVRITEAVDYDTFNPVLPSIGDTFDIEQCPVIPKFQVNPLGGFFSFKDLNLANANNASYIVANSVTLFRDCFISNISYDGYSFQDHYNCLLTAPSTFYVTFNGFPSFYGGGSNTTVTCASYITFFRYLFQDAPCYLFNALVLMNRCGIFDSYDSGIIMDDKSNCTASLAYGSGNSGYGVFIRSGSQFLFYTANNTVTGATGDLNVGSISKTWATVPFVNPNNLAMAAIWE
jgi:hypothetical protein